MKAFLAVAVVGFGLIGPIVSVAAQPYGGSDYGRDRGDYRDRGDDRGRDDRYRDRDDGYRERGSGYGERVNAFDEREYLRCNPDVRRAVASGQMASGAAHYKVFGRREGRRLSC